LAERRTNEMIPKTMATVKLQNCNHKNLKIYFFLQHYFKEGFPIQVSFILHANATCAHSQKKRAVFCQLLLLNLS